MPMRQNFLVPVGVARGNLPLSPLLSGPRRNRKPFGPNAVFLDRIEGADSEPARCSAECAGIHRDASPVRQSAESIGWQTIQYR